MIIYNASELRDDMMCTCGHPLEEHHISFFPGGGALVEECEYYGSNEYGGKDENGNEHCETFVLLTEV